MNCVWANQTPLPALPAPEPKKDVWAEYGWTDGKSKTSIASGEDVEVEQNERFCG